MNTPAPVDVGKAIEQQGRTGICSGPILAVCGLAMVLGPFVGRILIGLGMSLRDLFLCAAAVTAVVMAMLHFAARDGGGFRRRPRETTA